jgi:hypothetical protein
MMPKGAGAVKEPIESPSWYRSLSDRQLAAYIRYQFVRYYENESDWDTPAHSRRRNHWDGGKDKYGVRHSAVWPKIVQTVRELRADPGVFVAAHFSGVGAAAQAASTNSVPDIRPTHLRSAKSPGIYQRYVEQAVGMFATNCDVAGGTIANRMRGTTNLGLNQEDQLYYVLCDEGYVSATPFFRQAFAARMGCDRAVERYLWHAALDYEAQQRLYDLALQKELWCMTAPLLAAVVEIRTHWMEYADE